MATIQERPLLARVRYLFCRRVRLASDLAAYYLLLFTTQRNISEQRSQIVNLLVAKGVDVNLFELQGKQTPLHLAAINGYAFVCK